MSKYIGTSVREIIKGDNSTRFKVDSSNGINDTIFGFGGNDTIYGGNGNDTLYGGEGNDTINGQKGNDKIIGDNGNDIIYGENGIDKIYSGNGNDTIYGGENNDTINGQKGNDKILGDNGNDIIYGENGVDKIYGGNGNDVIYGGNNNDIIYGDNGNDTIYGGIGSDVIRGGFGINNLTGGAGGGSNQPNKPEDIFILTKGAANPDIIHIPIGDSEFQLAPFRFFGFPVKAPTNFDRIYDFDTNDKLDLDSATPMRNTKGLVDGNNFGSFSKHSISNGIIKLYNTQGQYLEINTPLKAALAYKYLVDNCAKVNINKVGALQVNTDIGDGSGGTHTIVIEAHSAGNITAVDIVGNVTNTVIGDII